MSKLFMLIGNSSNLVKLQKRLLEEYGVSSVSVDPPYIIPDGCTGVIILKNGFLSPNPMTRDIARDALKMAEDAGLPYAIVQDDKWSRILPVLLMKNLLERDTFNEDLDPEAIEDCAVSCTVEHYLKDRIPSGIGIWEQVHKVYPENAQKYRYGRSEMGQISALAAWALAKGCTADELLETSEDSPEEVLLNPPQPFDKTVKKVAADPDTEEDGEAPTLHMCVEISEEQAKRLFGHTPPSFGDIRGLGDQITKLVQDQGTKILP